MNSPVLASQLTLDEVCETVNRLRKGHRALARSDKVTGRRVRFYVERELLPGVRSGPGKKYPGDTVWKILFIRLLQLQRGLPLKAMRHALQQVPVETMRRVVTGEESLEFLDHSDPEAVERHLAKGYQVVALPAGDDGESMPDIESIENSGGTETMFKLSEDPSRQRPDDSPRRLRELTDLAKAAAISAGLAAATGAVFEATIESIRYGVIDRQEGFRRPAELRVTVASATDPDCTSIRSVPESRLANAIAAALADAAGETYRVGVVEKRYGSAIQRSDGVRLTLQVALA